MGYDLSSYLYGNGYIKGSGDYTKGEPISDNKIDYVAVSSSERARKELRWMNVNSADIGTIVEAITARTMGISIVTQVLSKDKSFNTQAEELIDIHNTIGVGELTNKHHFNSAMRAISTFVQLDGGIMVRHHYNTSWEIPYKYELVSIDTIDTSKSENIYNIKKGDPRTINGIVYNKWNQPTHIYIYNNETKSTSDKVSIKNITYYSEVWANVGQQLAVSKLVRLLTVIDKNTQYGNAELEAATEEAKAGGYLMSTGFAEIMKIIYEQIQKETTNVDERLERIDDVNKKLSTLGIKPKSLTVLPGDDTVTFNGSKRDSIYGDLTKNSEMKMASSQGMSAISVFGKADDANYSAIKFAAETDALAASIRFDDISNKIISGIYRRLIRVGIQIGAIKGRAAYWKNPIAYSKFEYIRKVKIDIEPAKNASADKTNLENETVTRGQIIEQKHGMKKEDFWKMQIQEEIDKQKIKEEMFKKAGIEDNPQEATEDEKDITEEKSKIENSMNEIESIKAKQIEQLKALEKLVSI